MEKINKSFMPATHLSNKALFSFFAFVIAVIKDILVSWLKLIPERGLSNRIISYCVIMPLLIIGLIFSVQGIRRNYKFKVQQNKLFFDINLLLALPTPLCFLYGIFLMIIVLFTV